VIVVGFEKEIVVHEEIASFDEIAAYEYEL